MGGAARSFRSRPLNEVLKFLPRERVSLHERIHERPGFLLRQNPMKLRSRGVTSSEKQIPRNC